MRNWHSWNVWSCFPREFYMIFLIYICSFNLSIYTFDNIFIFKVPHSCSFRLVIIKVTFKESTIWIYPLSFNKLTWFEASNVFHACLFKNIGTLPIFFAIVPLSWINIFIDINHDSLSISLPVLPISIIGSYSIVYLLTNTMFIICLPWAFISISCFFSPLFRVGICSSLAFS